MISKILMDEMKQLAYAGILVARAMESHGEKIIPAGGNVRFRNSMTMVNGYVWLWYNDSNNGTHIVNVEITKNEVLK